MALIKSISSVLGIPLIKLISLPTKVCEKGIKKRIRLAISLTMEKGKNNFTRVFSFVDFFHSRVDYLWSTSRLKGFYLLIQAKRTLIHCMYMVSNTGSEKLSVVFKSPQKFISVALEC